MNRVSLSILAILFVVSASPSGELPTAYAQDTDPIKALETEIAGYQQQLTTLGSQKSTLQSTINSLTLSQKKITAESKITQAKIAAATTQIQKFSKSIGDKEATISEHQAAIAKALRSIAEGEAASLLSQIISAHSLGEAWQVADETVQFNKALVNNLDELRTARTALASNRDQAAKAKATQVALQTELAAQNRSITATKATQQQLLTVTKNSEATYQKLLAAAKAELASYATFTTNAGGSKLLANQTVCDAWGCYYNQRDTLWGSVRLSGARSNLASEGCLVTAMAMMLTHYGYRNITPVTINANPGNFSPFGGLLLFTINVNGITATRKAAAIDASLATGHPIVVGIHAYGGTHFVILVSGSRGAYVMRDPYVANGKDISFTAHYSVDSIFSIQKVIITT